MGKITGFLEIEREIPARRPVEERLKDWLELEGKLPEDRLRQQGARCMDCGIPFCHKGCPLGNIIPDWNDFVYRGRWKDAMARLHATNNFPEFTGRVCPAPCEEACVLNINDDAVTIKQIEKQIVDHAFKEGWVTAVPAPRPTGKKVAVVGSGPAGLACAQQLGRAGHAVTVFERADRIGGLLRYGIPAFKLEKRWLERRLALLREEGIAFRTGCHVGVNLDPQELTRDFEAIVLAGGSTVPRDLRVPGRELAGIHFAMEYLTLQNRASEGDGVDVISARDKHVIIIGGGDTGADCLGTAHRQGARSVRQLELLQRPPDRRAPQNPWPTWPNIFRVSSAHEEGGERHYAVATDHFSGTADGRVARLHATQVDTKTAVEFEADLVLLAMGFVGPERNGLIDGLGIALTERGTVARDRNWMTSAPGVFATGDMQRGQSLLGWAIADGRSCARGVDAYLMGSSSLPAPVA